MYDFQTNLNCPNRKEALSFFSSFEWMLKALENFVWHHLPEKRGADFSHSCRFETTFQRASKRNRRPGTTKLTAPFGKLDMCRSNSILFYIQDNEKICWVDQFCI